MFRLAVGAVLLVLMSAAGARQAAAQVAPPTPLTGLPTVPKTLPVIGGSPFQSDAGNVAVASAAENADNVVTLIAIGASPDDVDKSGRTGLIYAALSNSARIAQTLIDHGAQLNIRDKLGYTALHWAAEHGSIAVMRLLLAARAVVDAQSFQGITPLMLAARSGNLAAVRLLLQHHADPAKRDYTGRDASGWAANRGTVVRLLASNSATR
jgi:ankyrin repeat protein